MKANEERLFGTPKQKKALLDEALGVSSEQAEAKTIDFQDQIDVATNFRHGCDIARDQDNKNVCNSGDVGGPCVNVPLDDDKIGLWNV